MKHHYTILLFCCLSLLSFAQRPDPDRIETKNGTLVVQPVFHGSVVFNWNNITVYVDPYGGPKAFKDLGAPDLVLITDIHGDHLNMETLKAIDMAKATLVVPQAVADQLPEDLKARALILGNGQTTSQKGISISAVAMYNLPETADSRHPKGRGNGYVLNLGDKTIYLSGDTEDIPEMRGLKNIDVAFVCMNLPFTMDTDQAASAVLEFRPRIVYPYHYRGKEGLSDTEAFKRSVNTANPAIDVRLRDWYPGY